jgi:hypothetical protein
MRASVFGKVLALTAALGATVPASDGKLLGEDAPAAVNVSK